MASIDGMEFTSVKAALEASEKRIAELEAALRPFADAVYNDNGDVTISSTHIEVKHYMRAKSLLSQ